MMEENINIRRVELPTSLQSFPYLSHEEYLRLVGKKIILIRHAESIFQTSGQSYGDRCVNESYRDAKLTEKGRLQACQLGATLEQEIGVNKVELLVTSESCRAMQTAALAFGSRSNRVVYLNNCFAEKVDSWSDVEREIGECAEEHLELRGFQWHRTRSKYCTLPNGNPLPRRWNLDKGYPFERESTAMDRVKRCWQWLSDRKEGTIAVVTHSKLLGSENASYGILNIDPSTPMTKFANAEVAILTFTSSEPQRALPPTPQPTPSRHAIVVLGQALNVDKSPSEVMKDRIHATVEYFEMHRKAAVECGDFLLPRIIVSGGDPAGVGTSEASVMKRLLVLSGVPELLIIEESQSYNSCQNAWYVGNIVNKFGITGISLVTSEFHMPRSLYVFEAVFKHLCLYHVDFVPAPAASACAMDPERVTKMYVEHIRSCIKFEKEVILRRLETEFMDRHIPNIRIAPLGKDRLERTISDIELILLLHEKKYGL